MTYHLVDGNEGYGIMHVETDERVGWLEPLKAGSGFVVHRAMVLGNERQKIAIIKSVDEAAPAIAAYNEKHPPRWVGGAKAKRFEKWTVYGVLTVERQGRREWTVERSGEVLLRDGEAAVFATSDEAKQAADIHMHDGFPNSEPVDDGFSWYDYRAVLTSTIETKIS